jgi:ATP-dependent Clp protease ATP-binding subunit ClpB
MDANQFTEKALQAIQEAQDLARENNNAQVEVEHLLLTLLEQPEGVVPQVIAAVGASAPVIARQVRTEVERMPKAYGPTQLYLSQRLSAVLAERLRDEFVSTEHLLLGIIVADRGPAASMLQRAGLTRKRLYQAFAAHSA